MTRKIPLQTPLFLVTILFFMMTLPVQAENNITELNLTDIPIRVADAFNVDTFAGQLICSGIFMMICIFPVTIISRAKFSNSSWIPEVAISLITMGICISIDWLPVWFFLVLCLLISLMFAGKMRDAITGGK